MVKVIFNTPFFDEGVLPETVRHWRVGAPPLMALRRENWRDDDDDDDEHDLDVDDGAAFSISISFHFSCLIVALVAIGSILLAASAGDLASGVLRDGLAHARARARSAARRRAALAERRTPDGDGEVALAVTLARDTDRPGATTRVIAAVALAEQCAWECARDLDCGGWSYRLENSSCALKPHPSPARVRDGCCVSGEAFLAQRERVAAMDRSVALRRVRGALEASDAADPPVPRGRRERGRGGPEL